MKTYSHVVRVTKSSLGGTPSVAICNVSRCRWTPSILSKHSLCDKHINDKRSTPTWREPWPAEFVRPGGNGVEQIGLNMNNGGTCPNMHLTHAQNIRNCMDQIRGRIMVEIMVEATYLSHPTAVACLSWPWHLKLPSSRICSPSRRCALVGSATQQTYLRGSPGFKMLICTLIFRWLLDFFRRWRIMNGVLQQKYVTQDNDQVTL